MKRGPKTRLPPMWGDGSVVAGRSPAVIAI
jgi:hypothetical protein